MNRGSRGRRSRQVMLAAALIAISACAARGQPVTVAGAPKPVDPRLKILVESGDSAAVAKLVRSSCGSASANADCYERHLVAAASNGHVKGAMGALGVIAAADPVIRRTGHVYAHAIGIAAGKARGDIAGTFTQCSESFQSGCYHGVIQAWFAGLDSVSAADANGLCAPFRKDEAARWIRFQCVHGMGHGLTMLYDHDLPRGLAGCDLLGEWWDRHSCYSGAFMENIVNVTNPHHSASALAHHDGKAGPAASDRPARGDTAGAHDTAGMEHSSHAAQFKAVDPADAQHPCSKLAQRYLTACYEMQTSVMLYNNKGDIADAARSCDKAPAAMITTCYSSLGRDISSYSAQNHAEGIRMCSLGTARYQPWCYYGMVKNFIDLNARAGDGLSLCREVPAASRMVCYAAVGEQVRLLSQSDDGRRSMCSPAEPSYLDACLYGARVRAAPPPGLLEIWQSVKQ